jgi:SAM-dependent methyltransferase
MPERATERLATPTPPAETGEPPLPDSFRTGWKSRFEQRARIRDDDAGIAGWTASGLETRFRNFRRHWTGAAAGGLWLDIGCGAGTYTRFLREQQLDAVGIDYSYPTLQKARSRSGPGLRWLGADVARLPLPARSVDGVLCFGVLQAVPSSVPALEAIAAVLRPGGTLWIDFLNARCIPNRLEIRRRRRAGKPPHLRYESATAFVDALHACGYEPIALHWIPILPSAIGGLQRVIEIAPVRWLLRRVPLLAGCVSHSILVEARRREDDTRVR